MSSAASAPAEEPGGSSSAYTITVQNALAGETYTAYKLFDLTDANPGGGTHVKTDDTSVTAGKAYYRQATDAQTGAVTYERVASPDASGLSDYYELRSGVAYTVSASSPWLAAVQAYAATAGSGLSLELPSAGASEYSVIADDGFDAASFTSALKSYLDSLTEETSPKRSEMAPAVSVTAPGTGDGSTRTAVTLSVGGPGYYFVDTSLGALCSVDSASNSVVMYEKNSAPTVVKSVAGERHVWAQRIAGADPYVAAYEGELIYYMLLIDTGAGTDSSITVHDKMDAGLSINPGSISVSLASTNPPDETRNTSVDAKNYTVTVNRSSRKQSGATQGQTVADLADGCAFEVELAAEYVASLPDNSYIFITFNAIPNADASKYYSDALGAANVNAARLDYSNQTTPDSKADVRTYEFRVDKVDEGGKPLTDGVRFTLTQAYRERWEDASVNDTYYYRPPKDEEDGDYGTWTTDRPWAKTEYKMTVDSQGHVLFTGLAAGNYILAETDTTPGYHRLGGTITVNIAEDGTVSAYQTGLGSANGAIEVAQASKNADGTVEPARFTVVNRAGAALPSTGGSGTAGLYAAGATLVLGAGALLVARRRAAARR